jgi:glycosyltransferase involved in cell wall biosynthesis
MFTDVYWPRVNGVSVSVESFSLALIRAGHEVLIVCPFYPESPAIEHITNKKGVEDQGTKEPIIIRIPSTRLVISKEDRLAKYHKTLWVAKYIDDFGPDIIHVNTEFVIADFGMQYAWIHRLPTVYTYHTLWEDYIANYIPMVPHFLLQIIVWVIVRAVMRRANMVIVPTQQIREHIKTYKVRKEIRLLPTGIDARLFDHTREEIETFKTTMIQKYPALKNKRILLFVGRITREKNLEFLFSLAPEILEKHPETVFLIVGNGPDLYAFQEQCEKLGIASSCVFTGYLDRKDVALTYAISDIFVFPSLTETQGLVTIEAMVSGIPVVAIGAMGTLMVMNGDNGGFMVKPDRDEFIRRVFDLLEDDGLYRQKAEDARNYAKKWSIDALAVTLESIYRETIRFFKKRPSGDRETTSEVFRKKMHSILF